MSDVLAAEVNNEKFYILPVCNLPTHLQTFFSQLNDLAVDAEPRGFRPGVGGQSNLINSVFNNLNYLVIPQYLKEQNIDYVSFSANPEHAFTNSYDSSPTLVVNIVYELIDGINPFTNLQGASYNFVNEGYYNTQIKVKNGELIPLDLKSIYAIADIFEQIFHSNNSADRINKAVPYNITLWKKFIKSDNNNALTFLQSGKLTVGYNLMVPPEEI